LKDGKHPNGPLYRLVLFRRGETPGALHRLGNPWVGGWRGSIIDILCRQYLMWPSPAVRRKLKRAVEVQWGRGDGITQLPESWLGEPLFRRSARETLRRLDAPSHTLSEPLPSKGGETGDTQEAGARQARIVTDEVLEGQVLRKSTASGATGCRMPAVS
jgi:hypothetical protein